ncbi:MAG: histidine phosphatase family protein [Pseudomonadota bacterium]
MEPSLPLIYAVRHGITDWNVEWRLQGAQDIVLNEDGRRQATNYGRVLGPLIGNRANEFDFVSSPLLRTRETMERLRTAMNLVPGDYRKDERLTELSFGDWEGRTLREIAQTTPEKVKERARNKWDFQPPGKDAESYEILKWRVAAWLNDVKEPTVCVCHGGVIRVLFNLIGNMSQHDAALLSVPQDKILKVENGALEWLDAKV